MIEHGLRYLLANESTVSTLVSSRVFVGDADQGAALPYITIEKISSDFLNTLDGTSNKALTFKDIDVNCYGKTDLEARNVAKAVRVFLDDYSGAAGTDDDINAVLLNDENDGYIAPTSAEKSGRYLTNLGFTIQHTPL